MSEASGDNAISSPQPDGQIVPPAGDRLPLSVRIIAWVWLILGVSSLVDVILKMFVTGHGLHLDFGVLGIFIGRGLLLRRRRWLKVACGCGALLLGFLVMGTVVAAGFYLFWTLGFLNHVEVTWGGPPPLVILLLLGLSACLFWHQRVLYRSDVGELFRRAANAPPGQPARRFQFSLGTLLMLAVMAAWVLPKFVSEDVLYEHHVAPATTMGPLRAGGRIWQVHSGYRTHRFLRKPADLQYVVFLGYTEQPGWVVERCWSSEAGEEERLQTPDGTSVALPTDCQLIECIDGRYRESPERVTKAQLDAFLASDPAEYTIDALLEFARAHPE